MYTGGKENKGNREDEKAWQRERPKAEQLDKIAFDCVSRVTPVLPITRKGPTAFAVRPCTFWLPMCYALTEIRREYSGDSPVNSQGLRAKVQYFW